MRVFLGFLLIAAVGFCSWIAGSIYPAPSELLARLHAQSITGRIQQDLQSIDPSALRQAVGEQRFQELANRASAIAAAAGNAVVVEHQQSVDTSEARATPPSAPAVQVSGFEPSLSLCGGMSVANAPPADPQRRLTTYTPFVTVSGVRVAVYPTHNTCLSSGFGMRGIQMHKGIDFYNPNGGPILAAADGVILEMKYRDDYGNMILIDHGHGVYTRYCHLSAFQRGLAVGSRARAGDQIGLMGNTAAYAIPVHLHYELLTGDYNNPRQSFGLAPHSPFEFHA